MRRWQKKKSSDIIQSFLRDNQFRQSFTNEVVKALHNIKIGQRIIRKHFACKKAKYECLVRMFDREVKEYVKNNKKILKDIEEKDDLEDESVFYETEEMLKEGSMRDKRRKEEYKRLRELNQQLMKRHKRLLEVLGKKMKPRKQKPLEDDIKRSLKDKVLKPYYIELIQQYLYLILVILK